MVIMPHPYPCAWRIIGFMFKRMVINDHTSLLSAGASRDAFQDSLLSAFSDFSTLDREDRVIWLFNSRDNQQSDVL